MGGWPNSCSALKIFILFCLRGDPLGCVGWLNGYTACFFCGCAIVAATLSVGFFLFLCRVSAVFFVVIMSPVPAANSLEKPFKTERGPPLNISEYIALLAWYLSSPTTHLHNSVSAGSPSSPFPPVRPHSKFPSCWLRFTMRAVSRAPHNPPFPGDTVYHHAVFSSNPHRCATCPFLVAQISAPPSALW